jgi:imidazoleglycerol phosphate synthase glutamine amidotransferase subunit HisH
MTTVLVDYESGNLHSAEKAFQRMAAEVGAGPVVVTSDPDQVARADRVVSCPATARSRPAAGGCSPSPGSRRR